MPLTGLEIFKLLPKTNCKECGVPTCLAFAMQLSQKKADLSACPYASEEAKRILGAASEPPMRIITAGGGEFALQMGGETEMFRHEKTFYHQTAIFIAIDDDWDEAKIRTTVTEADNYMVERVGEKLTIDGFCINNISGDYDKFIKAVEIFKALSLRTAVLRSKNAAALRKAAEILNGRRPIFSPADGDINEFAGIAKDFGGSLVVSADGFNQLSESNEKIIQSGFKELIINPNFAHAGDLLQKNTIIRRSALRKSFKPFGFPLITYIKGDDEMEILADASLAVCKYSGAIVLPRFAPELLFTLFTLRQNIYTDPQKPIQVDPKVAAIGEPDADSPVFVTTNFSLTYFIVSGELENAGISAWLLIPDCEGMSVLTAWAAGKFSGQKIANFVKATALAEKVATREIVIPGYVASISGDLEEALPGWKAIVGPQEASDLAPFIKNYCKS